MGALQLSSMRAGTIRRVIRRGSTFICGLCRSTYTAEGEAQSCIQGCWSELLALDPVIVKRRLIGVAYRCRFCARDYQARGEAASCAAECKAHQTALHDAEQSLTPQSDLVLPSKKSKPGSKPSAAKSVAKLHAVKTGNAPTPPKAGALKPGAKSGTHPGPVEVLPQPISADVVPQPSTAVDVDGPLAAPSGTSGPAKAPAAAKDSDMLHGVGTGAYSKKKEDEAVHGVGTGSYTKKDGGSDTSGKSIDAGPKKFKTSEAFFRDGARYVCNGCQAKYFTRGEVEACFAKH